MRGLEGVERITIILNKEYRASEREIIHKERKGGLRERLLSRPASRVVYCDPRDTVRREGRNEGIKEQQRMAN